MYFPKVNSFLKCNCSGNKRSFFWKITAYTSHGVAMMCENCKDILIIADFIKVFMGKLFSGHPV